MKRVAIAISLGLWTGLAGGHEATEAQHQFAELGDLVLENGATIPNARLSYVTHGRLDADRGNVVLVLHHLGGNHHSLDRWVGPGRAIDTRRYFVISPDELGNSQTGFAHSSSPTQSGLRMRFPRYSLRDQVAALYLLMTRELSVRRLAAIVGVSTGAEQALQLEVSRPGAADRIVAISGGALWSTQRFGMAASVESVFSTCPGWHGGAYDKPPPGCAARALETWLPFFYTRSWWEENAGGPDSFRKWRTSLGASYLDIQDARDLYYRQLAAVQSGVGDTPGFGGDLAAALRSIGSKVLFVSQRGDQWIPPEYVQRQASLLPDAQITWIDSTAGHFICCDPDPEASDAISVTLRRFLYEGEAIRASEAIRETQ